METQSHSETETQEHTLDDTILNLINTRIATDLEKQGLPLSESYHSEMGRFWEAVKSVFGKDEEKRKETSASHPILCQFSTPDEFRRFYKDQVLAKIRNLKQKEFKDLQKQLDIMLDLIRKEGNTYNFFLPFREIERGSESHQTKTGGIHTEVVYTLPNGKELKSLMKYIKDQSEFKQEQLLLKILEKLGHKVPTLEADDETKQILSTDLYRTDLQYILEKKDGQQAYDENKRYDFAKRVIDILIPALMDLTSYKDKTKTNWETNVKEDLGVLFKNNSFDENRKRFGLSKDSLKEKVFRELKTSEKPSPKTLKELTEKYNTLILDKLNNFQQFIVHGDLFAKNVLEDFDGNISLIDFSPFEAPITFDLYSAIEYFGIENKETELLEHAAKKIWEAAKQNDRNIKIRVHESDKYELMNEKDFIDQIKKEYQWMSIHRNMITAGTFYRLARNESKKDEKMRRSFPDPNQYYSRALKALDKLGEKNQEYRDLGTLLRKCISEYKDSDGKQALAEVEIKEIDCSHLGDRSLSLSINKTMQNLADVLGLDEEKETTADSKDEQRMKQVTSIGPHDLGEALKKAKHGVPKGSYDGLGAFEQAPDGHKDNETELSIKNNVKLLNEALKGKIVDEGTTYKVTLPYTRKEFKEFALKEGFDKEMPDKINKMLDEFPSLDDPFEFNFDKLEGDVEYSIRGKKIHIINHRAKTRYVADLEIQEDRQRIFEIGDLTKEYTDKRTVWDTKKLLQATYGKNITIDNSLEDRVLFKKKGLFGTKIIDEILFDSAREELQLLKYLNDAYQGHGHVMVEGQQITVNGQNIENNLPVLVLDKKNRIVEGEHISVFEGESTKGPKTDKDRLFKPAEYPFALKNSDGKILYYQNDEGQSKLVVPQRMNFGDLALSGLKYTTSMMAGGVIGQALAYQTDPRMQALQIAIGGGILLRNLISSWGNKK